MDKSENIIHFKKIIFKAEVLKIEEIRHQEYQDVEWAKDWKTIVEVFDSIDTLKKLFKSLDVSYLREVQQKILILNLEKYAFSLQNYIIEKYSKENI